MTNATENGRDRVVMAGAMRDQITRLYERAEQQLTEACEARAKSAIAQPGTYEHEQNKRREHWHLGRREAFIQAADELNELLAVSIKGAQRDAERAEADKYAGVAS